MINYTDIKNLLTNKPKELTCLAHWLFVTTNITKSIIDNTAKHDLNVVLEFINCTTTSQIQQQFDIIQGRFGQKNFSQRRSPNYLYLCSLVANYPNTPLMGNDRELIKQFYAVDTYLLYDI